MHFYIILRRETGLYISGNTETSSVTKADRYYSKKLALRKSGPNTCVCGPYSEEVFHA
jgi:hypothetical protein